MHDLVVRSQATIEAGELRECRDRRTVRPATPAKCRSEVCRTRCGTREPGCDRDRIGRSLPAALRHAVFLSFLRPDMSTQCWSQYNVESKGRFGGHVLRPKTAGSFALQAGEPDRLRRTLVRVRTVGALASRIPIANDRAVVTARHGSSDLRSLVDIWPVRRTSDPAYHDWRQSVRFTLGFRRGSRSPWRPSIIATSRYTAA